MEYKLSFKNGRSTYIECEATGTPLQDKINKAEKNFGSEVVKINDKPVKQHELGGFIIGAIIGGIAGEVVGRRTSKTSKANINTKTPKTSSSSRNNSTSKTTSSSKASSGTSKSSISKKYLPNGLIKSIDTTSGKRIFNENIVDGTYPKTSVKVPANNRYSKVSKDLDPDKTLSSQTNYLTNRKVKSVNTTFGKIIAGKDVKDGFYIVDGVKFAKGGSASSVKEPYSKSFFSKTDWQKITAFLNKKYSATETDQILNSRLMRMTGGDNYTSFVKFYNQYEKEFVNVAKEKFAKGGMIEMPNSNLLILGFKNDTNGNKVIRVSYPNKTAFSIQTNGNLPYSHKNFNVKTKVAELTADDLELIEKEVVEYVKLHGSKAQKDALKVYSKFAKGGALSKATYIPNRDIDSLKTTYGQTIDGKKLIDGAYATGKVKKPKMSRTQFEDETFEYAKGGFVNSEKINKKTYFMVVKNWVYFTFNFPITFVTEIFGKHIEDKFISLYSRYGAESVIANLWLNLDNNNRKALSKYIQNNYFNSRADQNQLLNIELDDYNDIITHWNMFGLNYPHNFVEDVFKSEHFSQKFDMAYQKAGSTGAVNRFFVELSGDNQEKLTNWVYENYSNTGGYKFAKGGYLPNGLVKSVDTTSGKRIFNKDIIDGVYPAGDLKVPANNRYSKIAKNLDSDKNLTEQANYLPKRRIKSVNTTFGKRLYPNDIKDGMYIKAGVKFATGGAVRKSGNEAKYQRQVDEVNRLISLAFDSYGDPIPVVDINSTWEQPYVYLPVNYTNGTLRISYYEVGGMDHGKAKKDIVKKSEMYFDNPLPMIARMYRKAIKQNKKQEENN
jgi:hypothetical protein